MQFFLLTTLPFSLYLGQLESPIQPPTSPNLEQLPDELGSATPSALSTGAADIFNVGREVSADIAAGFNPLWENVMQGGLYQAMADVGVLCAVIALGVFLVQWFQKLSNGNGDTALGEFIWPLMVIVLLSNNGAVLSATTLELRNVGNQINETVLGSTVRNVSLQEQYQNSRLGSAIADAESVSVSECREKFSGRRARPQQSCIATVRETAIELRQQHGLEPAKVGFLRSTLQLLLRTFLFGIHLAFQYVVELVLLITALLGPLAVGLSLLPGTSKPMFAWLEGMASVFLIKLTLNLISGLAAYASSLQQTSSYSLVLPIVLGILAPILSVLVGLQGGAAFFNSLTTAGVYMGYRGAGNTAKRASTGSARAAKSIRQVASKGYRRLRR